MWIRLTLANKEKSGSKDASSCGSSLVNLLLSFLIFALISLSRSSQSLFTVSIMEQAADDSPEPRCSTLQLLELLHETHINTYTPANSSSPIPTAHVVEVVQQYKRTTANNSNVFFCLPWSIMNCGVASAGRKHCNLPVLLHMQVCINVSLRNARCIRSQPASYNDSVGLTMSHLSPSMQERKMAHSLVTVCICIMAQRLLQP